TGADLAGTDLTGAVVALPALAVASSLVGASLGLNLSSGQESAELALPESAVGMVSIETPVDAEASPASILELMGAVEALSRLAIVVGVSRGRSDSEGGSSVAVISADEVRITLSRLSYGSPFLATLVEYGHAAAAVGGSGGAAWAIRDVLKGEHSKLYNLLALLTRPSERRAVGVKRDRQHQIDIARLDRKFSEETGREPGETPTTIESQWTIEPSSRNELAQRIEIDETLDPIARAEMIRALDQLAPLVERGFSVTITEPVLTPDTDTPQQ
ncbi:hypothetical protein, partial [Rhodococcus qingshengii]|uniref:hypothetical protein n=1 Tax=Rhodococcus qingshengii TaxID=334542 RepID=UPI0022B3F5F4